MTPRDGSSGDATDRDPVAFGSGTPVAEWIMAAVGALIAAAVIGLLLYYGATQSGGTPDFTTTVEEMVQQDGFTLVRVRVSNVGRSAAAAIAVEGHRRHDGGATTMVTTTLDHLAPGASRTVGLRFPDTATRNVTVRVTAYQDP